MGYVDPAGPKIDNTEVGLSTMHRCTTCAAPSAAVNDGVDLVDSATVLLAGWKTIVAVMVVVGIVGLVALSRIPNWYRASTTLQTVAPLESDATTPLTNAHHRLRQKVAPEVLDEYALMLQSQEILLRAAEQAGLEGVDENPRQLSAIFRAASMEDSPEIKVAATSEDPDTAKRLVEAWVNQGIQFLAAARSRAIEVTTGQLQTERDKALEKYHEKRQLLQDTRIARRLTDKQNTLRLLSQRLGSMQQSVQSGYALIRSLEARTVALKEQLKVTPPTRKVIQHLDPNAGLLTQFGSRAGTAPLPTTKMQVEVEQPNPTYDVLEETLTKDIVELDVARQIVKETPPKIAALEQEVQALQTELDESTAEVKLVEHEVGIAQREYFASDDALAAWNKLADQQFPVFAHDKLTPISTEPIGQGRLFRLLLLEAGAFMLGCMLVLAWSAYRKQTSAFGAGRAVAPAPCEGHLRLSDEVAERRTRDVA